MRKTARNVFFLPLFVIVSEKEIVNYAYALEGRSIHFTHQHPYLVSINKLDIHSCGGSLIAINWVVTAAHCMDDLLSVFTVRAGSISAERGGYVSKILSIRNHPLFNLEAYEYDISLLKLKIPFRLGRNVKTIRLPTLHHKVQPGTPAVIVGWGRPSEQLLPTIHQYQEAVVPILPQWQCEQCFPERISVSMFCAGYTEGGNDACQGDSGGPLIVDDLLIGIISWGRGCGRPNLPGVYTNVSRVREFILKVTGR